MATTCTYSRRETRWRRWMPNSPKRCSTILRRALRWAAKGSFSSSRPRCSSGDTIVDAVDTEPHLKALTQQVAGCLAVPGGSEASEVNSGWEIPEMSEELVESMQGGQPWVFQTSLTRACFGHVRVVTSIWLGIFYFEAQSCPLRLAIETRWKPSPVHNAVYCAPWGR